VSGITESVSLRAVFPHEHGIPLATLRIRIMLSMDAEQLAVYQTQEANLKLAVDQSLTTNPDMNIHTIADHVRRLTHFSVSLSQ
jgi:hypothetical protein